MDNRGIDQEPGWINRQLRELRQAIEALRSERRAAATMVSSGDLTITGGGALVVKDGGDIRTEHSGGATAMQVGGITTGGGNPAEGWMLRDPSGALIATAYRDTVNGDRVALFGATTAPLKLAQSIAERHYIESTVEDIVLKVPAGRRVFISHDTTAAGANCFINTDGTIWRSTSSLRYKQDVTPAEVDTEAVLALQPRAYRSRAEVAEQGERARVHAGFIAEEAADLGLEQWVVRDDDGAPEAFNYSQFCVAQQAVIQQQARRIADMAARLERLERAQTVRPDPA